MRVWRHDGREQFYVRWLLGTSLDPQLRQMDIWHRTGGEDAALDLAGSVGRHVETVICRELGGGEIDADETTAQVIAPTGELRLTRRMRFRRPLP